jgi:hypothetical protein
MKVIYQMFLVLFAQVQINLNSYSFMKIKKYIFLIKYNL